MSAAALKLERAGEIIGWMSSVELAWLAEQASNRERVVEIGSFLGRSTRALADNASGRVFAIDTWRDADPHPLMERYRNRLHDGWCYEGFLNNVRDLIPSKLEVRRRKSLDAAKELAEEGKKFDLIFIDGAHDRDSVLADIEAWTPLLADGGLMAGHDFCGNHPGVYQAVRQAFQKITVVDTIWIAA